MFFLVSCLLFSCTGDHHTEAPRHELWLSGDHWVAPDPSLINDDSLSGLITYGKNLIENTSFYFGPSGSLSRSANGLNCQNCHLDAGTRPFGNNFGAVASLYPKYRERSGSTETIIKKISDCFRRSLNASVPDTTGREMLAIKAYLLWLGHAVPKNEKPPGTGLTMLPLLARAADSSRGHIIFNENCARCHGADGAGKRDETALYIYPPLWGEHSYTTGAGMYRLTRFASFVKYNMPFSPEYRDPVLTDEQCWDVAAFVNSQSRPAFDVGSDWPVLASKSADVPTGPFTDSFPQLQHKFGPFAPIEKWKQENSK